ncbi:MAG TPA: serine hydrolase [Naasia sp.]
MRFKNARRRAVRLRVDHRSAPRGDPLDIRTTAGWRSNTTGGALIRAGVPEGWRVGDRTGDAAYGTRNDAAVLWPDDGGAPILLVVMSSKDQQGAQHDDALIAEAAREVTTKLR